MRKWFYSLSALLIPLSFAIACSPEPSEKPPEIPSHPDQDPDKQDPEEPEKEPQEPEEPSQPDEPEAPSDYQAKYDDNEYPDSFSYQLENRISNYAKDFYKLKGEAYFEKNIEPYEANKETYNDYAFIDDVLKYVHLIGGYDPDNFHSAIWVIFNFQELFDYAHIQVNHEFDYLGYDLNKPWDQLRVKDKRIIVDDNPFLYKFQIYWDEYIDI